MYVCYMVYAVYILTECVVEKIDIGFIVDSSGSVSDADWKKV